MKQTLIRNTTKAHWGLPIPPPPTYTRCRTCAGPVIFGRCEICQPVTAAEIQLAEDAEREAEMEAA